MRLLAEIARVLAESWLPILALIVVVVSLVVYFRNRKQIVFESWINMSDGKDTDLGRSVADLLLFKIGYIKSVHERSTGSLGNWNIYRDVPAFRQSLDEDVKLMGSVELGKYGPFVSAVTGVLFRLLPMVFRPARLRGSIHKHGSRLQLLATLEFNSKREWGNVSTFLWEAVRSDSTDESVPGAVEELAFRIYLDLTREELFKSWQGFQAYTRGLENYLRYLGLQQDQDYDAAKKDYGAALAIETNNPAVKYSLGVLEYYTWKTANNDAAINLFQEALGASQAGLRAYAHSGLASALLQKYHRYNYHEVHLLEDAVFHAQRAIEIDPELDMSNRALAFACHQLSEYQAASTGAEMERQSITNRELAIQHYRRAYELNPQNYPAHNNLANLYLEWAKRERQSHAGRAERNLREAIRECEETIGINPQFHLAYDNMANAYRELKMFDRAYDGYRNALRYRPKYPEGCNDLAGLFLERAFHRRNVTEALRIHQEALAMLPDADSKLQRQKLCSQFGNQWKATGENAAALDIEIRKSLQSSQCTCVAAEL
jgi:tetratricopeptide (TPR) repeat protein